MTTFGMITPTVAGILIVIVIIIFGPGKLSQLGKGLGRGIKDFKAEVSWNPDNTSGISEGKES